MTQYPTGCLICRKPLVYFDTAQTLSCDFCATEHKSNAACETGHYICDGCHANQGMLCITQYASSTQSDDPIWIATEMMRQPQIHMHGPEHHCLVVTALLSAYHNAGGSIDLQQGLQIALQRAQDVPGGTCGLWGCCGAGIASGIFISLITGATPLSRQEWSLANCMTSTSLATIAANGGPRCCKRNTYLAITQAVFFVAEHFGVDMKVPDSIQCFFSHKNQECRGSMCPYFSRSTELER